LESSSVKLADNLVLKPYEKALFTKKKQSVELIAQKQQIKEDETFTKPKLEIKESVEPEPII